MDCELPSTFDVPEIAVGKPAADPEFALAVRHGLGQARRALPAVWHYDNLGSTLFEAICLLPEYDLTRVEDAVLGANADEVLGALGPTTEIIELGSGVASKTLALVHAGLLRNSALCYRPIDISQSALDAAERRFHASCPGVAYRPILGDYTALLKRGLPVSAGRRLVLFLGSNIGNYEGHEGIDLLTSLRSALAPGDGLLLGAALKRPAEELLAAYDDPTGVTAAFNRNVLGRINRELGGTFDLRSFAHEVSYSDATGVVESYLVATKAQRVEIGDLKLTLDFRQGERIHTESSCKYSLAGIRQLGEAVGFRQVAYWTDAAMRFCDALFIVS